MNGKNGSTVNGGIKPQKMVIKAFKKMPEVSADYTATTKELLRSAIRQIYTYSDNKSVSYEQLYRAAEDMCIQKQEASLYALLQEECLTFIQQKVATLQSQCESHSLQQLEAWDSMWRDHCDQLNTIRNVFIKLDRGYCLQHSPGLGLGSAVQPIWDMGHGLLRAQLEQKSQLLARLVTSMLATIESYRQGELLADRFVLARLAHMLVTLNLYRTVFEPAMLSDSNRFFKSEGEQLVGSLDTAMFLAVVDKRLAEAEEMAYVLLHHSSRKALLEAVETQLLRPHTAYLVEKGLHQMLSDCRVQDLKRLFLMFTRVHCLDLLKSGWTAYIRQQGEALVSSQASDGFVDDLLQLQERLDMLLKTAFFSEESLRGSLKSGFEHLLNLPNPLPKTKNRSAELLARFMDRKLRGERGLGETEVEALLDKVMVLFRYLQDKDIFEAFYKKYLAKRLLLGKSSSYDLEKSMLSKLKAECGSNFTAKLEGMFQDVELSREVQTAYQQHLSSSSSASNAAPPGGVEMSVQVLTTGYWPSPQTMHTTSSSGDGGRVVLPPDLRACLYRFESFYGSRYQGRRLLWAHSLERCVVAARFPKGRKDLEVSLFQALILKCFNKSDKITYSDIAGLTGIEDGELRRTLQSLANGPLDTRVILKEPRGKEVSDSDSFVFNANFSNKLFRIKINTIQLKETSEDTEKTLEDVFRDREYQVDASIVRTMKARKRLSHTDLMGELLSQLRFPAQISDLKKRIESLIEREYLERDKDAPTFYNYLA